MGQFCRMDNLRLRGLRAGIAQIVQHRAAEKDGLLEHHGEAPAQSFPAVPTEGHAVQPDLPRRRLIGPDQQVDQGGLARAGLPHKCGHLPCPDAEAHMLQHRPVRLIGEGHIRKGHLSPHRPG